MIKTSAMIVGGKIDDQAGVLARSLVDADNKRLPEGVEKEISQLLGKITRFSYTKIAGKNVDKDKEQGPIDVFCAMRTALKTGEFVEGDTEASVMAEFTGLIKKMLLQQIMDNQNPLPEKKRNTIKGK